MKKFIPYCLVVCLLALIACGKQGTQQAQAPPPVSVSVYKVSRGDASYTEDYPATVKALQEVQLRPQISGYITGIFFKEGDQVNKGQKLYSIDPQQSEAAYQQAKANLALQEANLEKAKKDLERYRALDKQDAIAKQQVDYAETAYETAQKQVEAARAAAKSVQTNVRYSTIVAPFDGTIGISNVRLGAAVSPGQTVLNTISTNDPMAVDIPVEQSNIYRFTHMLSEKTENKSDSTFRLVFGKEVYPYPGKISVIDRAVDPQTGTIQMRLVFPNPDHTMRAGMNCTVLVKTQVNDVMLIPYKAVTEQLGEFFVYVTEGSTATQQRVTTGQQVGRNVIIKDGLKVGQMVITQGIQDLHEGSPVTVAEGSNEK